MSQATYDPTWDLPHQPNDKEMWQESDWLTFYDPKAGAGAVFRLGRQPNRGKGQPNLFCFANGGQRFLMKDLGGRGLDCDMGPDDLWDTGCQVAGHRVDALGDGKMRYRWDYPETSADLQFHDGFYEPRGWDKSNKGAEIMSWINPDGHLECGGRLTGTMRVGDQSYDIDCFCHRDRSWGYRENYMERMKDTLGGWGTCGKELSFAYMMLHVKNGDKFTTGFVARNGVEEDIADVRCLPTLDMDMISPLAAIVVLTLESGETIRLDCDIAQAQVGYAPGSAFNSVGTFEYRGQTGFCDISVYANPGRAEKTPQPEDVTLGTVDAGLSPTADHSLPE